MSEEKITFEINGTDYVNLKKFEKQHKHCLSGTCGDKLSYSFIPTGMGMAITVKCSCGQKLSLGDFMDYDSGEYDEKKNRPLTEKDLKNQRFEEAVNAILVLENPRLFRIAMRADQTFDLIYAYAAGLSMYADERIAKAILPKIELDELHSEIKNYTGTDSENIQKFYGHFKRNVLEELDAYQSDNQRLREECL